MNRLSASIVLAVLLNAALAFADLEILYSPKSIVLQESSELLESSEYSKFISLCLAYTTEKPRDFNGFYGYKNFANIPRSVITFTVPFTLKPLAEQTYPFSYNSDIEDQFSEISHSMTSRFADSFSEHVQLYKNNVDLQGQIDALKSYYEQLKELKVNNKLPERMTLWFDFSSASKADSLSDNQFRAQMQEVVKNFRSLFDDNVLLVSILNEDNQPLKRIAREAKEDIDPNFAYQYDANFHTAFATIGFTTILLLLAVFGVSVAMWNIDPGRDSIIYRLTAQKMKKDQ